MDLVFRRNTDQMLIESTVMNAAEAETVAHDSLAGRLEIADDVSGIEKPTFLESADRALTHVRG